MLFSSFLTLMVLPIVYGNVVTRTSEEIKKYTMFLDKSTKGKAEAPLTPELGKLQNEWERSGAFEGDIILTKDQRKALVEEYAGTKNAVLDTKSLWPNNTLYYHIEAKHYTSEQIDAIKKVFELIKKVSCIKIKPKSASTENFVHIVGQDKGCRSHVGYLEMGGQVLNLYPSKIGTGCFTSGIITHELLHALGFYHMHSTHNRDEFVKIQWDKIKSGHEYNFNKYNTHQVTDQGVKYDYGSILHYSEYSFSTDGSKTIIPTKPTNASIGQRNGMSEGDILKLNKLYKCPGF